MFDEKMEADDNRAESVDDITAAPTAPMPITEMYGGVRCCRARGRIRPVCPRSHGGGKP